MHTVTYEHGKRLENLIEMFAVELGYMEIEKLKLYARFHDIGKSNIPKEILLKPGMLSPVEKRIMQSHSLAGCNIVKTVAAWILHHHEWWNGQGYPMNLKGENIPIECRILGIVDAYDAMTSERPYINKISHGEALSEIQRCAGTQFDPNLVDRFIKLMKGSA
ncbi:MAG: HD-GYP domain-containing protein [Sporomusa sp.]